MESYNRVVMPTILLMGVLILGAGVRFYYADANSYWYDEVLSVYYYGISNESILGVFDQVTSSLQMPLYQSILYGWMSIFGDDEVATRSLSNLYIVGATACLYAAVRHVYGGWLGVVAALVFTLMFIPTYYGMETRAYAQSIFLTSLSTLLLIYALPGIAEKPWRRLLADKWLYALLATNCAVLMTHYYNVFFLGAQGVFILIYLLYKCVGLVASFLRTILIGFTPVAFLLATWLPFMISAYERKSPADEYTVTGVPKFPWETISDFIVRPNFTIDLLHYSATALLVWVVISACIRLIKHPNEQTLLTLWFVIAATMPAFLAFFLFLIAGHERYNLRYFSFSAAPLAVILVLGTFQIVSLVARALPAESKVCLPLTAIVAAMMVLPGGLRAVERQKEDWRGLAEGIVKTIESQPSKTFVVYSTNFKEFPMLDYYLSKYSDTIRVDEMLLRHKERSGPPIEFSAPDADYVIVAFPHQRVPHFPNTLKVINSKLELVEEHLDKRGRGYLVYSAPR